MVPEGPKNIASKVGGYFFVENHPASKVEGVLFLDKFEQKSVRNSSGKLK